MWKVIQQLLPIVLIVLIASQYIIPVIFGQKTWWLFKSSEKVEIKESEPVKDPSTLAEEIKAATAVADAAKAQAEIVKEKVEGNLKQAEDLKESANKII